MAMAVDSRQQLLGGMHYDNHLRYSAPQFTNPWASTNHTSSQLYSPQQQQQQATQAPQQMQLPPVTTGLDPKVSRGQLSSAFQQLTPTTTAHAASYGVSAYDHVNSLDSGSNLLARSYGADYSSPSTTQASAFAPTSAPQYPTAYQQGTFNAYTPDPPRPAYTHRAPQLGRDDFHEALDASRNMVGISNDLTPRPIYTNENVRQDSQDAYGFPAPHSAHSSISSASTYPSYYNGSINSSVNSSIAGSVDGSVTDYSSAGEEIMPGRQLPRPILNGTIPPAASSMMSQFNSKVSPSTQKKHKCKICDKRFTRPSSLQTHMYSHTGEKPFACDAEGCGRHFSVVSNLRRHKKVHRGENDHNSPDDE